ncbi:proline dehydrogenase family protein [Streptomyces sp. NPDC051956]|uniref:proline dehydrogenase family protein n=1 Tax=Streptomyces sp. NPDC051956 TaxID=3365677 RepID=UPI0037CF9D33
MPRATTNNPYWLSVSAETFRLAGSALKALAADPANRAAFLSSPLLVETFAPAAHRYVVAPDRKQLALRLTELRAKGYRTGVEYVGEEVADPDEVEAVVAEYLALIDEADDGDDDPVQLGFDLSNVGLLVSRDLAVDNTTRILRAAAAKNISVVISMERSAFVDRIIGVFDELAPHHENVALTVQAHLHRTPDDIDVIAKHGRKIRLVKGVYRERDEVALHRGPELNRRYVELAQDLLGRGVRLALGTHDATLLRLLDEHGTTLRATEIEMLHGSRPQLLKRYRERGIACRVATVYGDNWWLHFLHRLSEYPPNVLTALADLADPRRVRFGSEY